MEGLAWDLSSRSVLVLYIHVSLIIILYGSLRHVNMVFRDLLHVYTLLYFLTYESL
jgi:uncharacterized membrane protein